MNGNLIAKYRAFTQAIADGDVAALSGMVDKANFRAILPGTPPQGIDFTVFVPELERRRAPFSDFGQNVEVHRILSDESQVVAYYTMILTHDGELTSWLGGSMPPTGRTVLIRSIDMVTFDARGSIIEFLTMSDRLENLLQMS